MKLPSCSAYYSYHSLIGNPLSPHFVHPWPMDVHTDSQLHIVWAWQSCETKSGTESLGLRLDTLRLAPILTRAVSHVCDMTDQLDHLSTLVLVIQLLVIVLVTAVLELWSIRLSCNLKPLATCLDQLSNSLVGSQRNWVRCSWGTGFEAVDIKHPVEVMNVGLTLSILWSWWSGVL